MWVRSQDGMTLTDAKTFRIYYSQDSGYRIYCDQKCIREEFTNLGTYSTKEKALKVLDMMQNLLIYIKKTELQSMVLSCSNTLNFEVHIENYIFQMPQNREV